MRSFHHAACSSLALADHSFLAFARDLPLFPILAQFSIELRPQGFHHVLKLLPDHVDFGVVGDVFEHDMGHSLVDEAVADVAVGGRSGGSLASYFRLFELASRRIGQQIVGVTCAHDAGSGQG